jgi:hypothetical protein
MSYSTVAGPQGLQGPQGLAINLTSGNFEAAVKEEEELGSSIKRHTIDAILGLPRLGGFCADEDDEAAELEEEERAGKQKFGLDRDGEFILSRPNSQGCQY